MEGISNDYRGEDVNAKKTMVDGIFTALVVVSGDIDATLGRFSVNDSVNLS